MTDNTNNLSYSLALKVLKALGGDTSIQYESTDEIWNAINGIYKEEKILTLKPLEVNNLYDRATAGYNYLNIALHPEVGAQLTDDIISIATAKGWNISF